jgi:hypothetical protein
MGHARDVESIIPDSPGSDNPEEQCDDYTGNNGSVTPVLNHKSVPNIHVLRSARCYRRLKQYRAEPV